MHTTCVAFCLRRLCLRNSKYGRYLLKPILVIVLAFCLIPEDHFNVYVD